jgi:putative nucleotidyltransferase with HDIG domain
VSLEELVTRIKTGIILQGVNGDVLDMNAAAIEILGGRLLEPHGTTLMRERQRSIHEDGSPMLSGDFPSAMTLATGVECRNVVFGFDIPGRVRKWISVDTYQVLTGGAPVGVVSIVDDISPLHEESSLRALMIGVMRVVIESGDLDQSLWNFCNAVLLLGHFALVAVGFKETEQEGAGIAFPYVAGEGDYIRAAKITWTDESVTGNGPAGTAMRSRVTQVVQDIKADPALEPWWDAAANAGLESCIAIPMDVIGREAVLLIYTRNGFAFDATTVDGLEAITRELELGLAHVESVHELASALDGTITALSSITEIRDPYTSGHQRNVGDLGFAIAEELGLDPSLADLIWKGGQLHDVGKTAIPAEILVKPGKLSAIEFEMVKQHPTIGAKILAESSLPWPIAEIALQHHERMDGSGYPSGMPGGEIPLPSRIIAVADVLEAMSHRRPYRAALGIERALSFVSENAGTLFDADVVRCALEVLQSGFAFEDKSDAIGD